MDEQNELERSISDAIDDEPHQNARIKSRKRVFLFNCDRTYGLDSVEKLLLNMKGDIRQQLSFDIVKTSFRLSEMSHVAERAIHKLKMDVAFFVVHANESRLSINEENAGIGYAKLYKALLQATDGKVIVVIGGDDHYKNQDEEESSLISRWAKRKVSSQFTDEFLDGRKSFIFSWNKTYRKIHEEALLHYFDPSKRGQKFERKPNDRPRVPEETLHKTPVTEKPEAKEHEQFTDARDIARSSSEKEVNKQSSVSEMRCYDKEDKLKEERKSGQKFDWKPNDQPGVPQETLHKTPVTEKPGAKEHVQFTDHPHAMDITHSSAEKEVNKQTSVSEAGHYDKGDKLKEERKKGTESEDLEDNGNGLSEGCTRKIASRKATETKDVLTSHSQDTGTMNSDGFVGVNKDHLSESEAGYYDKGDKLKEERKKGTESKDLEDDGNGLSEDCTRKIASRKATETKDVLTSHLRDIGTINSDGYVVVKKDDLAGISIEEQMNGRTKHGTLMMKSLVRNGCLSYRDNEMVVNPQWIPPGGFIPHITEQLQHMAEAEVIIYRMEETGALIVFTREVSNLSVVYDMITYFWHMMTGMFDRVYNLFL